MGEGGLMHAFGSKFDLVDNFLTAMGITILLMMAFGLKFEKEINIRIERSMDAGYPLLYALSHRSVDGSHNFKDYLEKACKDNSEVVTLGETVNITEYLEELPFNRTCWRLYNSSMSVIIDTCRRGHTRGAYLPLENGMLEVRYT